LDILQHKTKNIKTGFDNCPSEDIKITADWSNTTVRLPKGRVSKDGWSMKQRKFRGFRLAAWRPTMYMEEG
jgi:hypothetical protein